MEQAPRPRFSYPAHNGRAPTIGRRRRRLHRLGWTLLPTLLVAAFGTSCAGSSGDGWWAFNELPAGVVIQPASRTELPDAARRGYGLHMHPNSTEAITVVDHGRQGRALQFPQWGHAALVLPEADRFDPGSRDFEVSAWISVTAAQIGPDGSNVVQKGLGSGSQWKIQVDDGYPACGFVDTEGRRVLWAGRPSTPVTDGAWYRVTCRKTSTEVSLTVQRIGQPSPRPQVEQATLGTISNDAPVTIGSKGTATDYDLFRGRIDNIAIRVY
jgi:hypothetical protein